MSVGHQLIIDCGLEDKAMCHFRENSLTSIRIQTQQAPVQYNYYLLISNHLQESCQLTLKGVLENVLDQASLSGISIKIFYHDQNLFNASLSQFIKQEINLLELASHGFNLYRLEFYLTELSEQLQIDFSLNFLFNCQPMINDSKQSYEILGAQSEEQRFQHIDPIIKQENVLFKQRLFLSVALLAFLLLCGLILLFYRSKFLKSKKIIK